MNHEERERLEHEKQVLIDFLHGDVWPLIRKRVQSKRDAVLTRLAKGVHCDLPDMRALQASFAALNNLCEDPREFFGLLR